MHTPINPAAFSENRDIKTPQPGLTTKKNHGRYEEQNPLHLPTKKKKKNFHRLDYYTLCILYQDNRAYLLRIHDLPTYLP